MNIRHGKHVDPEIEARLIKELSDSIDTYPLEHIGELKTLVLETMGDWKIGASPALRLLQKITDRIEPNRGPGLCRIDKAGNSIPMNILGG